MTAVGHPPINSILPILVNQCHRLVLALLFINKTAAISFHNILMTKQFDTIIHKNEKKVNKFMTYIT